MLRKSALIMIIACAFVVAACGSDSDEPDATSADLAATAVSDAEAGAPQESQSSEPVELVATVNGEAIPLAEFQRQVFEAQHYYVDQGLDPNSDEGQLQLLSVRRQVLDDMIDQALIEQAANELGITVTDDELAERMALYLEQFGSDEELEASFAKVGTTREQIEEMERSAVIGLKMRDVIAGDVGSEKAAAVHVRHILCDTAEECELAQGRIMAGEDFATVAQSSKDDTSKDRGGDLDWIARGTHWSQAFEDAIFSLPVGQVSSVVATEYGFHVIEVLEKDDAHELTELQINNLREKKLMDWLADRRATAQIEVFIDDLADNTDS